MMKKKSNMIEVLLLIMILSFFGCSSGNLEATNAYDSPQITSFGVTATSNIITSSPLPTNMSTSLVSEKPEPTINSSYFGGYKIGRTVITDRNATLYIKNHSIYSQDITTKKESLIIKTRLDIIQLFLDSNKRLFYVASNLDGSKKSLYLVNNRNSELLINDVDEVVFINQTFIYYINNKGTIKKYSIDKKATLNIPIDGNKDIINLCVFPDVGLMYFIYNNSDVSYYSFNFNTEAILKAYEPMNNDISDMLQSVDNKDILIENKQANGKEILFFDNKFHQIYKCNMSKDFTIQDFMVKNNKIYSICLLSGFTEYIYIFDMTTGLVRTKVLYTPDQTNLNNIAGFCLNNIYYNENLLIYLLNPVGISSKEDDPEDPSKYVAIPEMFLYDTDNDDLKKIYNGNKVEIDLDFTPFIQIVNNDLWIYRYFNGDSTKINGTYEYWYNINVGVIK